MSEMKKYSFAKMSSYSVPEFKEVRVGDFINYGDAKIKNYPDYWISLFYGSAKHSSILHARHKYVVGGGWSAELTGSDLSQKAKAQKIITSANPKESLNEVVSKCEWDRLNTGGYALEVIRSKDRQSVAAIYHIDIAKVKIAIKGKNKGIIQYTYCYLPDWKGVSKYEVAKQKDGFKEWNLFWDDKTAESTIYYYKPHRILKDGEIDAYPVPDWISACGYIEADKQIQNFHVNNIKNNFWGGQIVEMTNVFSTEEERDNFVQDFTNQKTGTDNAGETMFIFTNEKDSVKATPLSPSELDKQFDLLNKTIRMELALSHRINLKLVGNEIENQAFSKTEFFDLYELYYSTQVIPEQNVWNETINYIYSFNGFHSNTFRLNKLSLVQNVDKKSNLVLEALNSLSPLVANKVLESMNVAEIRNLRGLQTDKTQTFSNQRKSVLDQFKELGEIFEPERIVHEFKVELSEDGRPKFTNEQFSTQYFAEILGMDLSKKEVGILSAIQKNPKISILELADAFELKPTDVSDIIAKLKDSKIIKGEIGKSVTVSKKATTEITEQDVALEIEVRYKYSDKGAPALLPGSTSRPFCEEMMALSKAGRLYKREEIDSIENDEGESAWLFRGGFYTNPNTDKTTPFCRHFWESVIVKSKK
jgi:hypothetical protein